MPVGTAVAASPALSAVRAMRGAEVPVTRRVEAEPRWTATVRTAIPLIPEVLAGAPMGHAGARSEVTAAMSAGKARTASPVERRARTRAEAGAVRTAGEPAIAVAAFRAAGEPASAAERRTVTVPMSAEGEAGAVTRTSPAFATAAGARTGATRTRAVPVGTIAVRPVPFRAFAIGAVPLRAVAVRTVSVRTAAGAAVVIAAAVVVEGFRPPRGAIPRLGPQGLQGTDREGVRHQEQE